tara:strand:- start:409 stop:606 length:198 start_codon:yes stop_codon:yes gene_type:complete
MSSKTNLVIGYWNNFFTHTPIHLATKQRRIVELDSALWRGVVSTTQQNTVQRESSKDSSNTNYLN